jgi:transposase
MRGGINANLLFKWRRKHVRAMAASTPTAATLLPVCVIGETAAPSTAQPTVRVPAISRGSPSGLIEIEIVGARLRLRGTVDETTLSTVLRALRQSA